MPHTHVELSKTGIQGRPHDHYQHVKITRLNDKPPSDKSHYLLAAISEVNDGEPVSAHYPGPTVGYIIEGELHVKDESHTTDSEVTKAVASDVIHVDQDSRLVFSSPNKAKVFIVSYAPSNLHLEDYVLKK